MENLTECPYVLIGIPGTSSEGVPTEIERDSHAHPILRKSYAAHGDEAAVQ